jgi:hypothetical protein
MVQELASHVHFLLLTNELSQGSNLANLLEEQDFRAVRLVSVNSNTYFRLTMLLLD